MEICYYHRERSHVPPGGKRGNHLQKSLGIGYDNSQEGNMIAFNFQRKHLVSWPQPSFRCCVLLNTQDVLNQFTIRFTNLSRYYNTSTIELMKCWRLRNLSFQFWSGLKTAVTYNTSHCEIPKNGNCLKHSACLHPMTPWSKYMTNRPQKVG